MAFTFEGMQSFSWERVKSRSSCGKSNSGIFKSVVTAREKLTNKGRYGFSRHIPIAGQQQVRSASNFENVACIQNAINFEWKLNGKMAEGYITLATNLEEISKKYLGNDVDCFKSVIEPEIEYIDSKHFRDANDASSSEQDQKRVLDMVIENHMYESQKLRKIHVELTLRTDGLQVLHIVVIPRLKYNLPIFGLDLVGVNSISFAVVDLLPASMSHGIPEDLHESVSKLLAKKPSLINNRAMPDWFTEMSSSQAVCLVPKTKEQIDDFIEYAKKIFEVYLQYAMDATPANEDQLEDIKAAHNRFFINNCQNSKTRMAIAKCFGNDYAIQYMEQVMFDSEAS